MVKPVDLQDNLSKTESLEKIQQLQKSTPEEAQKQFAQEMARKISEGKTKVADLPQADKIIIHRGRKEKKRKEKKFKGRKKQKKKYNDKDSLDKKIDYIA